MKKSALPLFYHQTTVVLIDDNEDYLTSLCLGLEKKGLRCKAFSKPKDSLSYIYEHVQKDKNSKDNYFLDENQMIGDSLHNIVVDLSKIYKKYKDKDKENYISVVVSDYQMPEMNGDILFSAITDNKIKKLMLTGKVESEKAIELLNNQIINNFTEKTIVSGVEDIFQKVQELQTEYFNEQCRYLLINNVINEKVVNDVSYNNLIESILNKGDVTEHYIISTTGSRLFINKHKEQIWLFIASEDDFLGWIETGETSDATKEILEKLNTRKCLLPLLTEEDQSLSPKHWGKFLCPCTPILIDGCKFYYSIIKNHIDIN